MASAYKTKATALAHIAKGENFANKPFDPWRSDREVIAAAVARNGYALLVADSVWQNDPELFRLALPSLLARPSPDVHDFIATAGPEFLTDRAICLQTVTRFGQLLGSFAPEFRADREIVLAAIRNYSTAYRLAHPALQADLEVIATLCQESMPRWACSGLPVDLAEISDVWTTHRHLVHFMVQRDPGALALAAPEFRADREIVLTAVRQFPVTWRDANAAYQNDPEIARLALVRAPYLVRWLSPALRQDIAFIQSVIAENNEVLSYLPEYLGVRDFCLALFSNYPMVRNALRYASPACRADSAVVRAAVAYDGAAIKFAAPHLRADPELAAVALTSNRHAFGYLAESLQQQIRALDPKFKNPGTALRNYLDQKALAAEVLPNIAPRPTKKRSLGL